MVRICAILAIALAVTACDVERYQRPITFSPHGEAVRTNMAAQIIDPRPPRNRGIVSDSEPAILAIENYRTGNVKDPTQQATAPDTTSID